MKIHFVGGQLDGCVDDIERPRSLWISPDASDPDSKVIVYGLYTKAQVVGQSMVGTGENFYKFDQRLTDKANEFLKNGGPEPYHEGMS